MYASVFALIAAFAVRTTVNMFTASEGFNWV